MFFTHLAYILTPSLPLRSPTPPHPQNFALFLDGDLDTGSSGECDTFDSPCLASAEQFHCTDCELYSFESPLS